MCDRRAKSASRIRLPTIHQGAHGRCGRTRMPLQESSAACYCPVPCWSGYAPPRQSLELKRRPLDLTGTGHSAAFCRAAEGEPRLFCAVRNKKRTIRGNLELYTLLPERLICTPKPAANSACSHCDVDYKILAQELLFPSQTLIDTSKIATYLTRELLQRPTGANNPLHKQRPHLTLAALTPILTQHGFRIYLAVPCSTPQGAEVYHSMVRAHAVPIRSDIIY